MAKGVGGRGGRQEGGGGVRRQEEQPADEKKLWTISVDYQRGLSAWTISVDFKFQLISSELYTLASSGVRINPLWRRGWEGRGKRKEG